MQTTKNTIIACFGDSLTQGNVSYNWVHDLTQELTTQNILVHNFGVNGNLAFNALQRLDTVIKCQPDVVFILLGTNDVNAITSAEKTKNYIKMFKLPQTPSKEWYVENMEEIITKIKEQTKAKIILINLPLLGEDLKHEANLLVQEYNAAIEILSQKHQLQLLDFNQKMVDYLQQNPPQTPRALSSSYTLIAKAVFSHYVLFQPWGKIAKKYGFSLLTDGIHLNEISGKMLLELVKAAL